MAVAITRWRPPVRNPRTDPWDEPRQTQLGRTADPSGLAQPWQRLKASLDVIERPDELRSDRSAADKRNDP
jgi:hypothetical protein